MNNSNNLNGQGGNSSNGNSNIGYNPGANFQTFAPPGSFYPMQPPPSGMPLFPPMMPHVAGMMHGIPLQTNYPQGQGPLADRPTTRGENGLLQAPEAEGPKEHEAMQYVRLNPAETAKYFEYWSQASDGAEKLSGSHAVEFLSRAAKVSKGQLRRIWDLADHRKEGELDQSQFFVALRLVALAQRGAELSVAGLRNFAGIQLIPKIDPPPPKAPPQPSSPASARDSTSTSATPAQGPSASTFSWVVPQTVADRFDKFFADLAPGGAAMLDASHAVPFLTKSGLPRPTLKKVWQLADVSRDGLLSRDEFRTAMHLVTALRNKRVDINDLPETLDPSGPNWPRVEGEQPPPPVGDSSRTRSYTASSHASASSSPIIPPPPPPNASMDSAPIIVPPPPADNGASQGGMPLSTPPLPAQQPYDMQQPMSQVQQAALPVQAQMPPSAAPVAHDYEAERAERQRMLEALRREREEMERARREMEEMRAEMERMRIEKENLASMQATVVTPSSLPVVSAPSAAPSAAPSVAPSAVPSVVPAAVPATVPAAAAGTPVSAVSSFGPVPTTVPGVVPVPVTSNADVVPVAAAPPVSTVPVVSVPPPASGLQPTLPVSAPVVVPSATSAGLPGLPAQRLEVTSVGVASTTPLPVSETRADLVIPEAQQNETVDVTGADDDDLWDQPSPKASIVPSNSSRAVPGDADTNDDDVSDSSDDDDDDDFWGGMGPKPTLGSAGSRQPGAAAGAAPSAKGFGGSELDDWLL